MRCGGIARSYRGGAIQSNLHSLHLLLRRSSHEGPFVRGFLLVDFPPAAPVPASLSSRCEIQAPTVRDGHHRRPLLDDAFVQQVFLVRLMADVASSRMAKGGE